MSKLRAEASTPERSPRFGFFYIRFRNPPTYLRWHCFVIVAITTTASSSPSCSPPHTNSVRILWVRKLARTLLCPGPQPRTRRRPFTASAQALARSRAPPGPRDVPETRRGARRRNAPVRTYRTARSLDVARAQTHLRRAQPDLSFTSPTRLVLHEPQNPPLPPRSTSQGTARGSPRHPLPRHTAALPPPVSAAPSSVPRSVHLSPLCTPASPPSPRPPCVLGSARRDGQSPFCPQRGRRSEHTSPRARKRIRDVHGATRLARDPKPAAGAAPTSLDVPGLGAALPGHAGGPNGRMACVRASAPLPLPPRTSGFGAAAPGQAALRFAASASCRDWSGWKHDNHDAALDCQLSEYC
ncbi:hypothetical protein B0H15DRAFT_1001830 [Mycena belliarum]|uniref:Uncharacterized protein n=1 Tax=Mycena belliarum TaxID=1033014 RepID=A0AAD6XVK3_9AGAR|nr:hypothetical protein B0H15DRAFT_1001830 [Mycena belliae]